MSKTEYWKRLSADSSNYLKEYGYGNFKRTVAKIYNNYIDEREVCDSTKRLWEYLYSHISKELLDSFSEPSIGNPIPIYCNDRPVSLDLGCSIREYHTMSQHIDFNSISSILEIGGGYGRTAYVISKLYPNITYTICDIQPALSLSMRYLRDVLPNHNFKFIQPDELGDKNDLVIAIDCLHEMTVEQVAEYFKYVDENSEYFYYSCWKDTIIPHDNIRWKKRDYPVKKSWKRLMSQDHVRIRHFEELYKI